jgi:hypothetical protein
MATYLSSLLLREAQKRMVVLVCPSIKPNPISKLTKAKGLAEWLKW